MGEINLEKNPVNNGAESGNSGPAGAMNNPQNPMGNNVPGVFNPGNNQGPYNPGNNRGPYNPGNNPQYGGPYNPGNNRQYGGPYNPGNNPQYGGPYNPGYNNRQFGPYNQPVVGASKLPVIILVIVALLLIAGAAGFGAYKLFYVDSDSPNPVNGAVSISEIAEEVRTPEPTLPPPPEFTGFEASSTRGVDHAAAGDMYYYPSYAVDGDMTTAWSSNRNIELTPTYTLRADTKQHVRGVRMTNGYCKSMETYTKNRRITQVTVYYEGGSKTKSLSTDAYRVMQEILFDEPVDTSYIKIHVDDSIYGRWLDIAISEIEVF